MSTRKRLICIACGGSAGHIFPGLALAEELTKRYGEGIEILFLTSDNKLAQSLFADSGFNFYALPLKGIKIKKCLDNFPRQVSISRDRSDAIHLISIALEHMAKGGKPFLDILRNTHIDGRGIRL